MSHPCYICGDKVNNPFYILCYDHETIFQFLAEQEIRKNTTLDDFFSLSPEKEISQLEGISEVT